MIGRANLNGSAPQQNFITGASGPTSLEVNSLPHETAMTLSCSPSPVTLPGPATCTATLSDAGPFPAAPGQFPPAGAVSFASSAGGSFSPAPSCVLVPTGFGQAACQVSFVPAGPGGATIGGFYEGDFTHLESSASAHITAVNAPAPAPVLAAPKPSNKFTMAKPKLNLKKGTASVATTVRAPGKLVLSGKKVILCAKQAKAAGQKVNLLVLPKKKLREKLKEEGSAKVTVKVTFTPTGGDPLSENLTLTLRLRS